MNEVLDVFNTHDFYASDDTNDVNCKINFATNSTVTVFICHLTKYLSTYSIPVRHFESNNPIRKTKISI